MTILEVIQRSADYLANKGVASPRLQVELLLAHLLKMPRMNLYLNFGRELSGPETDALRAMVQRRGQREPLQYITGSVSFCGLEIGVSRDVLIPRPETEMLAERAWKFLASLPSDSAPSALDLCTGSGCLAIALAKNAPGAKVTAADFSAQALGMARRNAADNGMVERIRFAEGDLFGAVSSQMQFDLIVSNPPYIRSAEIEELEPEVREFEPRLALDGGPDGLDFYRRIAAEGGNFLKNEGRLMIELEEEGAGAAREIFAGARWEIEGLEEDLSAKPRILVARRGP